MKTINDEALGGEEEEDSKVWIGPPDEASMRSDLTSSQITSCASLHLVHYPPLNLQAVVCV